MGSLNSLPNARYERKFIADSFTPFEALALVRRHGAAFHEAFPPRRVNNIYLDSPSRSAYYDHINGASRRVKHRVRWYGPLEGQILAPVLERKFKSGSVSGKDSHTLAPFEMNGVPVAATICGAFERAALPERLMAELGHLSPCLINQYWRHYFVSGDGRFRLTVDYDFGFGAPHLTPIRLAKRSGGVPSVVLELKFEIHQAGEAEIISNALPMRMMRCSKFILGMEGI